VQQRDRPREVGSEEERALERRDENEIEAAVIGGDLSAELGDTPLDLLGGEVCLADAQIVG
jgi:hypothetical protein